MDELKSNPTVMPHERKKMLGILDRFEKQAIDQEQMLDMSEDELLQKLHQQQQEQLGQQKGPEPRSDTNAALGYSSTMQRKLTPKERDEIIRRAIEEEQKEAGIEIGQGGDLNDGQMTPNDMEAMERLLDQEHQDLINRFRDVDLDRESFDGLWARLNPEEQQEFREKFMITGIPGRVGEDHYEDRPGINTDDDDQQEELEARELLQEMGDTLKRGNAVAGDKSNPMLAELDSEDLRAIRDAEIAELISIWRPWWEIEAEKAGELKKAIVSMDTTDVDKAERLRAASIVEDDAKADPSIQNMSGPYKHPGKVSEKFVLDEEVVLRPHRTLVQDLEEARKEEAMRHSASEALPPMTRAPHPSVIYHISALLFAYAATSRFLNGDLKEEPEQTLTFVFDLCPFFGPGTQSQMPDVKDFETTLAILQSSSLNSKLWKGDTLRLDLLSLLLRDLALILVRPSRCLQSIQELKDVFSSCMNAPRQPRRGLYSKQALYRLFKKLEFYESYLMSDEWMVKSDRLDQLRTEVVLTSIRVRQEMTGWVEELGNVSRVQEVNADDATDNAGSSEKKTLIEEIP
ncbi:hypothetical protein BGX34_004248 [Mortierella sp. NVP85]|nr:hypothetical protein BGX34_004248 [Mortierella sp. NVP85]